jgi:hypothetical protein
VDDQQQARWRPTRRQLLWAGVVVAALAFLLTVICGYLFDWKWTGLSQSKVSGNVQPAKTLWDWLDLLIVPVVLAIGGYLFNRSERRRAQEDADRQRRLDREIADERRQDDMLQAYLDEMSKLITDIDQPLHEAKLNDSLSTLVRARTLTMLRRLNEERKANVVQFLYESGLISKEHPIVELRRADMSRIWLSFANLIGADLRGAFLHEAFLLRANLSHADLRGATLRSATLVQANLSGADLRRADLREADLKGASLRGANLSRIIIQSAGLLAEIDAQLGEGLDKDSDELEQRVGEPPYKEPPLLQGATMPNGQKYEEWLNNEIRGKAMSTAEEVKKYVSDMYDDLRKMREDRETSGP